MFWFKTIKELKNQVRSIKKELWELRNSQKFKIGDKVQYVNYGEIRQDPVGVWTTVRELTPGYTVVDIKVEPDYSSWWSREYLIHKNGNRAFWVNESRLKK